MSTNGRSERAGVIILSAGQLALIERQNLGRRYWVVPGGGVEPGETIVDAARREAREELGVDVTFGRLRVLIDHREPDSSIQRQWYFDAQLDTPAITMTGPELASNRGSYEAVWMPLGTLVADDVIPRAVARYVQETNGEWPEHLVIIDERTQPTSETAGHQRSGDGSPA